MRDLDRDLDYYCNSELGNSNVSGYQALSADETEDTQRQLIVLTGLCESIVHPRLPVSQLTAQSHQGARSGWAKCRKMCEGSIQPWTSHTLLQ